MALHLNQTANIGFYLVISQYSVNLRALQYAFPFDHFAWLFITIFLLFIGGNLRLWIAGESSYSAL